MADDELVAHAPPSGLTDAQKARYTAIEARLLDKIRAHLPAGHMGACPICTHTMWMIGSYVYLPNSQTVLAAKPEHGYPSVALFCRVCGNTHLLNLILLGFSRSEWSELVFPDAVAPQAGTAPEDGAATGG